VIDLHCHLLPGIDDGPETIEDSIALARAAVAAGVETIVATPHVSWSYPNDAETIIRLTDELNGRLAVEDIALAVRCGAEIALTRLPEIAPEQLSGMRLGAGRWLLVEPPFTPAAVGVDSMLLELQSRGNRILLAHPERCPTFQRDPGMLESLVHDGVLTSITAGSLVGRFGNGVRRFALRLVRDGLVHNVASDAHDCARRPPGLAAELEQAGLSGLTDWLTCQVPAAILDDRELPARPQTVDPEGTSGRRFWRRRRG
jgi:protein-tyrosine phosphatase